MKGLTGDTYRAKVAVMAAMAAGRRRVDAGDLKGAIRRFDRAVALDPLAAQAYLYRAGLKLLVGDEDGAAADFDAIARLDHSHLPAYRDLTTLSAEEFPALVPAAKSLLARRPDCAWAWVFHAFSLRSLMRYEQAIEYLDRAVACAPRSAALRAMRSRVKLTNRQDFYDGVRDMERAVRLAPGWGWLHCWLGEALRHQRKFRRALAALDRGLALDPRYRRGYAWRGGVKVALGLFESARRDLDLSLAFDPIYHYDFEYTADQKSWAYNQRQSASRGLGEVRQALRDLNEAHRFGPRYAWVYSATGTPADYERGIAELDAYSKRSPRDAWAWAWRGWTLLSARRPEEALESLRRARVLSPRAAWPAAWEGRALWTLGRHREASRALTSALRLDPSYAPAWGWRGQARRALGDLRGAVSDFTAAVERDHRAAWALAGRGEALQKLGKLERSLADLDRALGILPDYPQAQAWRAETRRLLAERGRAPRGTRALLAGFAKSVLAHRHAFVPGLGRTLEIGSGSRLPASFEPAYGGAAPAALDGALERRDWRRARALAEVWARREPSRWEPLVVCGVLRLWTPERARRSGLEALVDRFAAREGMALLEKAAARRAAEPAPRLWLSLALLRRVELPRAWKELEALCAAAPRWSWPFLVRSELGRVDIRYAPALRDAARALKLDPMNAWTYAFRARVLFQLRPGADGMEDMDRAAALSPREGWLRAWRADARRKLGDLPGAARDLEAALRLEPDYDRAWLWLGKVRRALGDARGAEEALTEGLRRCPHFDKALAERARARLALGNVEGALDDLEAAASINHRHNALWNWTAEVEPLNEEKRAALRTLAEHARAHPRSGRTWLWLGEALIQSGDAENGLAALGIAGRTLKRRERLGLFRGEALLHLGRLAEAERALDEAVRRAPSDGRARAFRGRVRFLRGRHRAAVADLELAASDSMIEYSWVYHWRALARRAAGDAAGAREDAATAAQLEPRKAEFRALARELGAAGVAA